MSGEVVPQVDVGALTLRGLGAFTPLLASLTADNVAPMAMIQMENLGAVFPISGEHAANVPDLLQRCISTRLDRLGFAVGWRKGDAASLMAQSAGGQAVALLSCYLMNLYKPADVGSILLELSQKVLTTSLCISSISQLLDVAKLLAFKLEALGFGNILAFQVTRIYAVYEQLSQSVPTNFLEPMTTDSAVELFHSLSRALSEEDVVVRVTGTRGMGQILAIILTMFPGDTLVTIDDLILQEGVRKSIFFEFRDNGSSMGHATIRVETVIDQQASGALPIETFLTDPRTPRHYRFKWTGCVADSTQLAFSDVALACSQELLTACCNLLVSFTTTATPANYVGRNETPLPRKGFLSLLGSYPHERMRRVCEVIFRATPTEHQADLLAAYQSLVQTFHKQLGTKIYCSCEGKDACNLSRGWLGRDGNCKRSVRDCKLRFLWDTIGMALHQGLLCLFVNAGANATISDIRSHTRGTPIPVSYINRQLFDHGFWFMDCERIHLSILRMGNDETSIARSSGSSTIYPTLLRTLKRCSDYAAHYELVEGQLMLNNRYYTTLHSVGTESRPKAKKSLNAHKGHIIPSYFGEHSDLLLTLRECLAYLELRSTIRFSGSIIRFDLEKAIIASYGLEATESCEHSIKDRLSEQYHGHVMTTSVAAPRAQGSKIAIVQTQGNLTAQLLSCEIGIKSILQQDCCLNCAYEQAKNDFKMIIVG